MHLSMSCPTSIPSGIAPLWNSILFEILSQSAAPILNINLNVFFSVIRHFTVVIFFDCTCLCAIVCVYVLIVCCVCVFVYIVFYCMYVYVYGYVTGLDILLICPGKDYNKLYIYLINYNHVYLIKQ